MTLTDQEVQKIIDFQKAITDDPDLPNHPEFQELIEQAQSDRKLTLLAAKATASLCIMLGMDPKNQEHRERGIKMGLHEFQAILFGVYVGVQIGEDRARIMAQLLK